MDDQDVSTDLRPRETTLRPSDLYDLIYSAREAGDEKRDPTDEKIEALARALPAWSAVLEPGSGTGRVILPLTRMFQNLRAVGVENSPDFIAACREKSAAVDVTREALRSGRLQLLDGNMLRLGEITDLEGTFFDLILFPVSSIVHVPRSGLEDFIRSLRDLLRPGGQVFLALSQRSSRDGAKTIVDRPRGRIAAAECELFASDEVDDERTSIRRTFRFRFDSGTTKELIFEGALHSYAEIERAAGAAGLAIEHQEESAQLGTHWLLRKV